ncbi:MAG: GAF domain-containing protein [Deltaproteobacteria bacterium]|nr:GAF domain-containing protein [Deltaproteobacteria bacterium]
MDERFELVKQLGEGGQGSVSLVRDHARRGRLVALKRVADDKERRLELAMEFDRLAGLRHPSLARAYDFADDDEGAYFTSEFVDGPDIISWAKEVDEEAIYRAMASLLRALALLHDRDLIHGDVSPGNVLVSVSDNGRGSMPKLIDLGGARRPGQPGAATTAGFAAPEVLTGRGLVKTCDLYSFGVLLAVVLFNKNPFGGGEASEIVRRQLAGDAQLPDPTVSPVAGLCLDLVSRDPALRPKSALETLRRLAKTVDFDLEWDTERLTGGDLPAPRIVGRRGELASLTAIIDQIDDPQGERTACLVGPSGSGRSAVLAEVIRAAQLTGLSVVGRAGAPLDAAQLISGIVSVIKGGDLPTSVKRVLGPWIGGVSGDQIAGARGSWSQSVGYAVVEALQTACRTRTVLIVVDDLPDCDQLVQEVAATLARSLAPERTGRPAAALVVAGDSPRLGSTWEEIAGVRAALGPLNSRDVEELVASMLPGISPPEDLAQTVYLASEGWPGSAEQLVRQAISSGSGGDLVKRAREMVAGTDRETKELLAVLSMVEGSCPAALLEPVWPDSERLDAIIKTGFVSEVSGVDGLGLRVATHIGAAARDDVAEKKQRRLADKLARELAKAGRLAQAGRLWDYTDNGPAAADAFGSLARECRSRGDLAGAGQWFEKALSRIPEGDPVGSLAGEAVETWRTLGKFSLALKELDRTDLSPGERMLVEAELMLEQGRHRDALEMARKIADGKDRTAVAGVIAAAELQLGLHEQALSTANQLMNTKTSGENEESSARLAQIGGLACTYLGRIEEAMSLLTRAAKKFEKAGDLTGQIKAQANQGMVAHRRGDLATAQSQYDKAVALAREAGDRPREGLHLMNRATAALLFGDIAAAYADYLASYDIALVLGNGFARAQVEINLADLLSGIGVFEEALKIAGQAIERCRAMGQERLEARAMLIAGVAMLRAGAVRRAERRLTEARRRFSAAGDNKERMAAELHLGELRLIHGDFKGATRMSDKIIVSSKELGRKHEMARALVLGARAKAEGKGDFDGALALLGDAEELFVEKSLPDDLWRLRVHKARILKTAGRQNEAEEVLNDARSSFMSIFEKVPTQYHESFVAWGESVDVAPKKPARSDTLSHRRERDLERLMEVNRELTREHDPKRLLALIMEHAVELTGAERGMVVMPRGDRFEPVISHQISEETDVNFSRSVAEKVVAEGRAMLAVDALGDDRFRAFVSVHAQKLRSILAVPLQIRRRVVGVVYLDSRLRAGIFTDEDRLLLDAFGAQAAIALETARLISENAKRCDDLQGANKEIRNLSMQLEEKLERNEAKLRRVGALLHKTQTDEAERLKESGIVGRSTAMQQVMRMIDRIALTDVPVYIYGASGTGKELVAKAIHAASERSEHPFVPVNCGALPPKLLASELFGHTRGAFTGAVGDRPGLFRLADGGTLFLDEMTDMESEMQAHLLRVLQDGTFRALGGNEEVSVDVRILSASNRDLDEEVSEGRFREDLFYRLNVVRIDVPPLTERREDVPLLADFFARRHGGEEAPSFSREAVDLLVSADWPGNVRELENEVLRAMTMAEPGEPIKPDDLSPRLYAGREQAPETWSGGGSLKERVDSFERIVIQRVLVECGQNATRAAKQLGISRAGLYKKLDKHSLTR